MNHLFIASCLAVLCAATASAEVRQTRGPAMLQLEQGGFEPAKTIDDDPGCAGEECAADDCPDGSCPRKKRALTLRTTRTRTQPVPSVTKKDAGRDKKGVKKEEGGFLSKALGFAKEHGFTIGGAALGALVGSMLGGPIGLVIGGILGGIGGALLKGLFS